MHHKLIISVVVAVLILTGCASEGPVSIQLCPGKKSAIESLSLLKLRSHDAVDFKASGQCLLQYYDDGKKRKENFPVKLWLKPYERFLLHGDIAFNAKGIVVGSNEREFWLSVRPKEISSHWWGTKAQGDELEEQIITPDVLFEALGIMELAVDEDWTVSNEDGFDILTKRNHQNKIAKKVYISSCDYLLRTIEHFDAAGQVAVAVELDKYKKLAGEFLVPAMIKIMAYQNDNRSQPMSVAIKLKSMKPVEFSERQRKYIFVRPRPKGFKHVYKVTDGGIIEQSK